MPLLLLFGSMLLLTAAASAQNAQSQQPDRPVELHNVTVRSLSPRPATGSGLLWFVRELVVTTEAGEQRTLYLTWLDKGDLEPAIGTQCDVSVSHWQNMSAFVGDSGTVIREGDAVDTIACHPPVDGRS